MKRSKIGLVVSMVLLLLWGAYFAKSCKKSVSYPQPPAQLHSLIAKSVRQGTAGPLPSTAAVCLSADYRGGTGAGKQ